MRLPKGYLKRCLPSIAILVFAILLVIRSALAVEHVAWLTGRAFEQRLAERVDVFWIDIPLRRAVESLAQAQHVAVLIDRRVDPGQKLNLTLNNTPLEAVFQAVADRCGLGIARIGPLVYFGPQSVTQRLPATSDSIRKSAERLSKTAQRKLLQSKPLAWPDLSTPRELVEQLARQSGVEIGNLALVPHDLWAGADLPPLSLVDRLVLILAQFNLGMNIAADGERLALVSLPKQAELPAATRPKPPAATMPSQSSAAGGALNIDQLRIEQLSIQAEPLGVVLRQLAKRLGLDLHIDQQAIEAAGISLDQRVTVKVERSTVDEMLGQILEGTGLEFRRRQQMVEIGPTAQTQ